MAVPAAGREVVGNDIASQGSFKSPSRTRAQSTPYANNATASCSGHIGRPSITEIGPAETIRASSKPLAR